MQQPPKLSTTPPLPGAVAVPALNDALQTIATDFSGDTDPAALAWPYSKWADTSTGKLWRRNAAGTAWVEIGRVLDRPIFSSDISSGAIPSGGYKNRLINGQGMINQRGYSSGTATTTSNQYTVDRWRVVTSGQSLSFSQSGVFMAMTAPAGGVEQVVEGSSLEAGTYALSWVGTATAAINGTPVTNGGTISLAAGANATVRFLGGTFALPQLEREMVTPFEYQSSDAVLSRCQRYYETSYDLGVTPGTVTLSGALMGTIYTPFLISGATVQFKVVKRATPTLSVYAPNNFNTGAALSEYDPGGVFVATRSAGATNVGQRSFVIQGAGNLAAGNYIGAHWVANAEL